MSSFYLYPLHIQVDCFFREILAPFRNKILSQNALFNNGGKALGNWLHCEKWNAKSNWCNCRLSINGRTFGITLSSFSMSVSLSLSLRIPQSRIKLHVATASASLPRESGEGVTVGSEGNSSLPCVPFDIQVISVQLLSCHLSPSQTTTTTTTKWNEMKKKEGKNESRNEVVACRRMKRAAVAADDDMSPPWLIQNLVENRTIFCQNLSVWVCE